MILLTAIRLSQRRIIQEDAVDKDLAERHSFSHRPVQPQGIGKKISTWILIQPEVTVPDQDLKPQFAVHGVLDYLIGMRATTADGTSTWSVSSSGCLIPFTNPVKSRINTSTAGAHHVVFVVSPISISCSDWAPAQTKLASSTNALRGSMATICEAKSFATFDDPDTEGQVLVQGASMCVSAYVPWTAFFPFPASHPPPAGNGIP